MFSNSNKVYELCFKMKDIGNYNKSYVNINENDAYQNHAFSL